MIMPLTFVFAPEAICVLFAALWELCAVTGTINAKPNTTRAPSIDSFFMTSSYSPNG
jgi:hypothetical protein